MKSGQVGWHQDGYLRFTLSTADARVQVCAHKIAWLTVHNEWTLLDHKDLDRGNNKLENLRKATFSQNLMNTPLRSNSTTRIKGVSFCKATSKWRASIMVYGKSINLGRYKNIDDAANAYAQAAKKYFGEFARVA